MSESDPTGYGDSPDTTDGRRRDAAERRGRPEADATLTTDDDAQRDDSSSGPGNEPD